MDTIAVFISAYNAERTLTQTIESVLAQTYEHFHLYLFDNASTDNTFEIMQRYKAKDDRIELCQYKENFAGSFMKSLYGFMECTRINVNTMYKHTPEEWVCFVDADDTIHPEYLQRLLSYAQINSLDMALCGWDFVRPNEVDRRVAQEDMIITKDQYGLKLPFYDKFMGPVWNKIFRYKALASDNAYYESKFAKLFRDGIYFYGADTCFVYLFLSRIQKFGILADSLYQYNILDDSVSRKRFNPMRIVADRRLAEVRLDFLQEIGCDISKENKDFILNIYFKSSKTTLDLLLHDDRYDLKQKMKQMYDMFNYRLMGEAFPLSEQRYM